MICQLINMKFPQSVLEGRLVGWAITSRKRQYFGMFGDNTDQRWTRYSCCVPVLTLSVVFCACFSHTVLCQFILWQLPSWRVCVHMCVQCICMRAWACVCSVQSPPRGRGGLCWSHRTTATTHCPPPHPTTPLALCSSPGWQPWNRATHHRLCPSPSSPNTHTHTRKQIQTQKTLSTPHPHALGRSIQLFAFHLTRALEEPYFLKKTQYSAPSQNSSYFLCVNVCALACVRARAHMYALMYVRMYSCSWMTVHRCEKQRERRRRKRNVSFAWLEGCLEGWETFDRSLR